MRSVRTLCRRLAGVALVTGLAWTATPAGAQVVFWLDTRHALPSIHRANADGSSQVEVALPAGSLPEGLALDPGGALYFAEAAWSGAKVQRTTASFPGFTTLLGGGSALRGIAVDAASQQIWWTSSNLATGAALHRAGTDGGAAITLLALPPDANPRGIAADPAADKLFWADFDRNEIWWSSFDGAGAAVLLSLGAGAAPYGVAVDSERHLLFWTEYGSGQVRRASTTGGSVTTVAGASQPTHLALDLANQKVYWSNAAVGGQKIRRANYDGTSATSLSLPITTYGGLAVGTGVTTGTGPAAPPERFAIERIWPTPGAGPFRVEFALPVAGAVRLTVHDLQGREIATLADGTFPAGRHTELWSATSRGLSAPPGLYFARLSAAGREWVRRIVLAR